jgi:enamine deaminase RidA (YjgF/YER057c/UK114 family)
LVFISGQTPRTPDGQRLVGAPFERQARLALDNLDEIAHASGLSLMNAVKVDVFLRDLADRAAFDAIYATYIGEPAPARTLVQSNFTEFDVEVSAVLLDQEEAEIHSVRWRGRCRVDYMAGLPLETRVPATIAPSPRGLIFASMAAWGRSEGADGEEQIRSVRR